MSATIEATRDPVDARLGIEAPPPLRVERVAVDTLFTITGEWADLYDRALEDNVFLAPDFALPLMSHVARGQRPGVVLAWEDGPSPRLLALLPVASPTPWSAGLARGFDDEQAALGTPLLDRTRGIDALMAILATLAVSWPQAKALVLTRLPADGPVAEMLRARMPHRLAILRREERAVLARPDDPAMMTPLLASAKRRKELRRQRRRLAEVGTLAYHSARSPEEVADATERFLALERRGWKGTRGTALLSDRGRAMFARAAMRRMAEGGMGRIDTLMLDDDPVAMGIVLTVRGRAHWWKTTYDQRYAALSPGVQFTGELTLRQCEDPLIALTDSCATAGHPMIGHLWNGRMPLVDVAVALESKPGSALRRAIRLEQARRALREGLKARVRRWGRVRGSVENRVRAPIFAASLRIVRRMARRNASTNGSGTRAS